MRRKRSMRCTVEPSSAHPVASAFSPSGVRRWACVASLCVLLLCLPLRQSHHVQNLILSAPDPFPSHTFRPHAALLLAAAGPIRVEQERTGEGVRYGVAYGEDDNDRSHEDSEEEDRDSGSSAAHSNEDLPPTTPSTPLGNERKNAHGTDGNLPQQKKSALVDDELEEWKGGDDTANATAQPKRVVSKVRRSRSNRRRRREARESSPSRRPTGKGAQQQPSKVMNAALEDFIGDASENEPMPEIPLERGNSSRAGQGETREWASTTPTPGWDREPVPPRAEPRHSTVTPLAVDFSPAPAYDEKFPDEAVDFGELIYHADLTREDLLHNPLVFNVGFLQYFGIQLSAYAINGVYMNDYERAALEEYLIDMEEIDPVEIRADEFLSKTTDGDSVNDYPDAYVPQIMDRYIVEQIGHGVFKNAFCEHFVKLMQIPDMPPLIVNMYNLQPGRFSRRCLYYRTEQLKSAKRKFVLLVSEGDYATTSSFTVDGEVAQEHDVTVSYLLNHPLLAHWYGVNGNIRHPKFTPVPLGFSFFHRSGRSLQSYDVEQRKREETKHQMYSEMFLRGLDLNKVFPHIDHTLQQGRKGCVWFETAMELFAGGTVDPPIQWIPLDKLPQRITTIYIVLMPIERERRPDRPSLFNDVLIFHKRHGNRAAAASQHIALLPFTAALYHKLFQHPFGDPKKELFVVTAFSVWDPRKDIFEYLSAHPEVAFFPSSKGQQDFLSLLNTYAFVASPIGYGYDCYRTWEALAFGSIPILQHPEPFVWKSPAVGLPGDINYGHEIDYMGLIDLYNDLPVVIIKKSSEITPLNLARWRTKIHKKMMNGEYKFEKLFMQYWVDKIYGHTNDE